MTMPLTMRVCLEVATHEAVIRQTYRDSVGKATWSVGLTDATGHDVGRYWGKPQSMQKCMDVYVWALDRYANAVRKKFKGHNLTEAQFAAALSFHWNTGDINTATWVKRWLAGDMVGAREAFMWYRKPPEIVERRSKECNLLFSGKWSNDGMITEYTRLTSRTTPVWASAKRVDIRKEIKIAMQKLRQVEPDFEPNEPEVPQTLTITPSAEPKPKPMMQSTTMWATIAQYATGSIGALATLDVKVAVPLIIIGSGFAFWIIRERYKKREEWGL